MTADNSALQHLLRSEAEYAEEHRNDRIPSDAIADRPHQRRSTMFSLRLANDDADDIHQLAREAGVPASTLVRGWITERLAAQRNTPNDAAALLSRLEDDARSLRRLVG